MARSIASLITTLGDLIGLAEIMEVALGVKARGHTMQNIGNRLPMMRKIMGNKYLTTINTFAAIAYSAITAGFFYTAMDRGQTDLALVIAFSGGYIVRSINAWFRRQKELN